MDRADRQAISLSGLGLGTTAVALAGQQLWPHAPWYIWFGILSFGALIIIISVIFLLHLHLSRSWKRRVTIAFIFLMCGGAFWYYKTLPGYQPPLSLAEVYITDFPQYLGQRASYEMHGPNNSVVPMLIIKHRDFNSNGYFLSAYIYDTDLLYNACLAIASSYAEILATVNAQASVSGRTPGDTTQMADATLQFTNLFYIYFSRELSPEQIGEIHQQFRNNGLIVQFGAKNTFLIIYGIMTAEKTIG
jgi:hypothetical protein